MTKSVFITGGENFAAVAAPVNRRNTLRSVPIAELRKPMNEIAVFICGPSKDHKCDDTGPFYFGGDDVEMTDNPELAKEKGYVWGSSSCSKCGELSMNSAMWE
jgi:hypothetical protein